MENAVKHGLDPDRGPLHILIRTRALDNGSELTVEDDGSGLSGPEDAETHVALDNIRSRLAMDGGTVTIAPRAGGGTVVTVVTVREAEKNKKLQEEQNGGFAVSSEKPAPRNMPLSFFR